MSTSLSSSLFCSHFPIHRKGDGAPICDVEMESADSLMSKISPSHLQFSHEGKLVSNVLERVGFTCPISITLG